MLTDKTALELAKVLAERPDMYEIIKLAQSRQAASFKPGDVVQFEHNEQTWTGVVRWINEKSVSVQCPFRRTNDYRRAAPDATSEQTMNWRVAPSFLKKIA